MVSARRTRRSYGKYGMASRGAEDIPGVRDFFEGDNNHHVSAVVDKVLAGFILAHGVSRQHNIATVSGGAEDLQSVGRKYDTRRGAAAIDPLRDRPYPHLILVCLLIRLLLARLIVHFRLHPFIVVTKSAEACIGIVHGQHLCQGCEIHTTAVPISC